MGDEEENSQTTRNRNPFANMFDWMKPNLSIGGIFSAVFWMGLLAIGVYFLAKNERVRGWLENILPDNLQAGLEQALNGMNLSMFPGAVEGYLRGLPIEDAEHPDRTVRGVLEDRDVDAGIAAILGESQQTWTGFLDLVKEANGSITQDAFLSEQTIAALLTRNPALAGRLIGAIPAPAAGAAPSGSSADILASVSRLAGNADLLTPILANDASRAVLAQAILKFAPGFGVRFRDGGEEALSRFLQKVGLTNGTLDPAFATALQQFFTGDATQKQQSLQQLITLGLQRDPQATQALINAIDPTSLPANQQQMLAQGGEQLAATVTAIRNAVGPEHANALTEAFTSSGVAGMLNYLRQHRDLVPALITESRREGSPLAAYRDLLPVIQTGNDRQLAAVMRLVENGIDLQGLRGLNSTSAILDYFLQPTNLSRFDRNSRWTTPLADLGMAMELFPNLPMHGFLTSRNADGAYINIGAVFGMLRTVSRHPANQGTHGPRTERVLTGLLGALGGDAQATQNLSAEEVTAFFNVPVNRQAFREMLARLDPQALDARTQRLVRTLSQHWGSGEGVQDGLAEALTIPQVADAFVNGLKAYARNPNATGAAGLEPDFLARQFLRSRGVLDDIEALRAALGGGLPVSHIQPGSMSPELRAAYLHSIDPRSMGSMK